MFVLARVSDNVRLSPEEFAQPRAQALTMKLNAKYANRVLHNVGLCVRVYDIESCSDAIVHAVQDGAAQTRVVFRIVVFRPYRGEVLTGRVSSSSQDAGIRVSLEFFDDVVVPPTSLPAGAEFDPEEGVWVWKYDGNPFYIDRNERIRVRVESEVFHDSGVNNSVLASATDGRGKTMQTPVPSDKEAKTQGSTAIEASSEKPIPPYSITASINESGLGLVSWWK